MSARIDIARVRVDPWSFPALDEPAAAAAAAPAAPPPEPEPAAEDDGLAEAVRAERQRGHAEGFERGFAEGREAGYAAGFAAGSAAAETELAAQARRLAGLIEQLGRPIAALDERVEEAVAALALEVARCVIGGEVSRSREYLVRLIREAVARVPIEMGAATVLLNPGDLELVRALAPDIDRSGAILVADETVEAGGAVVVAGGDGEPVKDRRWYPRAGEGASQVDLTLSLRWRSVILTLFDGEES